MSIKQATLGLSSIYKGSDKIASIYKGADLVYQSVKYDPNIVALLNRTLEYCDDLLGDEITTIPDYMFQDCQKLQSITIPKNVTSLGAYALAGCISLKVIRLLPITPPTYGEYLIYYNTDPERVECPKESYEAYSTATGWSSFASSGKLVGV